MHKIKLADGKFKYVESYKGLDGKRHRVSVTKPNQTKATEKQAYIELQEKINEKLKNTNYKNVGWYIDEFLKNKKLTVAKNTYEFYNTSLNILNKDLIINNVSSFSLEKQLNEMRKTYSPNTLKSYALGINIFYKYVREKYHDDIKINVKFALTKDDKIKEIEKIKYIETNKIKDVLHKIDSQITKDFVTVQLLTGLRAGELLALSPTDIDYKNNKINVTKTRLADGSTTAPKTVSSYRTIEVNDIVLEILKNYSTSRNYIFDISLHHLNYNLRKLHLTTHMFRHTHISMLVEQGVPIKVISERVGHSNVDITMNIYTHVTENMKIDLINKLGTLQALIKK